MTGVRLAVIRIVVVSLLLTLGARLYYLQVLDQDKLVQTANRQHTREVILAAPRGTVVDDYGRPLVSNRSTLVVSVNRAELQAEPDQGAAVLRRLSTLIKVPAVELAKQITPCAKGVPKPVLERVSLPAGAGGDRHDAGHRADDRGAAGGLPGGDGGVPDAAAVPEPQPGRALARLRRPGQPGRARRRPQGRPDRPQPQRPDRAGRAGEDLRRRPARHRRRPLRHRGQPRHRARHPARDRPPAREHAGHQHRPERAADRGEGTVGRDRQAPDRAGQGGQPLRRPVGSRGRVDRETAG